MPDLSETLRSRLSPSVALGSVASGEVVAEFPGEALPRATSARVAEFRAGREAARRAFARLGKAPAAIPMAADRSPDWPEGLVGSISHCDGACLAVVGKSSLVRGLGIDVEPYRSLPPEIWSTILRQDEIEALDLITRDVRGFAGLKIFVAKEAVYKAQYPISKTLFDFQAIRIDLSKDKFEAEFMIDVAGFPRRTRITGVFAEGDGCLAAVVVLHFS